MRGRPETDFQLRPDLVIMEMHDAFWDSRMETTWSNTLPSVHKQLVETGRLEAFRLNWKPGDSKQPHYFWESDVAKWVEGLCYAIDKMMVADGRRKQFMSWIDEAVELIAGAQQPDGYINVYYTVVEPTKRWTNVVKTHELYCAGHLLEAAIAHFTVTKSTRFLDVMCRYVDYIGRVFGPGKDQLNGYPGHQELELALMRLYHVRPKLGYLQLAEFFVEERGKNHGAFFDEQAMQRGEDPKDRKSGEQGLGHHTGEYWYMQAHEPIREQKIIRGHSVRALYFLAGVQSLANVKNDDSLHAAVMQLWQNMAERKFYIHGGVGAIAKWEGFGEDYELPLDSYAETCASIAVLFLGKEMLQHRLQGSIAAVMECALYNDVLGGISLDGKSFFYNQPLETKNLKRSSWFETSCCPTNVPRLLNSLELYVFTKMPHILAINFFIGARYNKDGFNVSISTEYPWHGKVTIDFSSKEHGKVAVRAPKEKYHCSIKGEEKDGYLFFQSHIETQTVTIEFEITPRINYPNPNVTATRGKLSVQRGPFVYALEECDSSIPLDKVKLSANAIFKEKRIDISMVSVIALETEVEGVQIQLVPYFTWGNRKPGEEMKVWIDRLV